MKIAVIGPIHPFRGGIAHSNTLLCENLSKKHEVLAISYKRLFPKLLFPGRQQKHGEPKKLPFKCLPILDSINPINWYKVYKKIKQINPDLVIIQWWTTFLAPCTFKLLFWLKQFTKIKTCIYCQNVLPLEKRAVDKPLTKSVFSQADYFIALSTDEKNILKKLKPKAKVEVMIEPTYEVQFTKKISKATAKKQLNIKGNVALFFGFVRPYKGLKILLESLPEVLKKTDLTLLIVGEFWGSKKPYIELIKKLNLQKNVIIIDDYVPDNKVYKFFSAADVCVLPYTHSTQSGILQVAYGYKVPVITTNCGSLKDIVKNNKTGYLVKPKDTKTLSTAIVNYFTQGKEKEFIANILKEKDLFKWDSNKEDILFHGLK